MGGDIGMLVWLAVGCIVACYAICFLRSATTESDPQQDRRGAQRRFWLWVYRQRPGTRLMIALMAMTMSIGAFSAAAQSYRKLNQSNVERAQSAGGLHPTLEDLAEDIAEEHRQAVADGKRNQWRSQIMELGNDGIKLTMRLLPHVNDPMLKSDLLYSMQQAGRIDLGIKRNQVLQPHEVERAMASMRRWRADSYRR